MRTGLAALTAISPLVILFAGYPAHAQPSGSPDPYDIGGAQHQLDPNNFGTMRGPPHTPASTAAPPPPATYKSPPVPQVQGQIRYYCDNPQGYYPYVTQCSAGWRQIPAAQSQPAPPGVLSAPQVK